MKQSKCSSICATKSVQTLDISKSFFLPQIYPKNLPEHLRGHGQDRQKCLSGVKEKQEIKLRIEKYVLRKENVKGHPSSALKGQI